MFSFQKFFNDIKKERERRQYFGRRGSYRGTNWRSLSQLHERHSQYFQGHPEELSVVFDKQRIMLDKNIIEYVDWVGRADITIQFEDWCEKNLEGFFSIHGWGNGRGNPNQEVDGIWRVHVDVMRKSDALLLKMMWK